MKSIRKHLSTAMALCILAGSSVMPVSAEDIPCKPPQYGDTNCDGQIDVSDAVLLARFNAEEDVMISTQGKTQGDVNLDGNLDTEDTLQILQYIAKLRTELGVQSQTPPETAPTVNLTKDIAQDTVSGKAADETFVSGQLGFTANLLRETHRDEIKERSEDDDPKNLMISPLSVSLALGMTANGAREETNQQMQNVLNKAIDTDTLNAYYYNYMANLPSEEGSELHIANSIWARNDKSRLIVPEQFLKTTKSYYNADFYVAPFDQTTVDDINGWVNENTHKMIPKLISRIQPQEIMYLMNAIAFEAEWETPYEDVNIREDKFTRADGKKVEAEFMWDELNTYIHDDKATGFIKRYKNGTYSFAAILPNKNVTVNDYIESMSANSLKKLLESRTHETVYTKLPKFSFDYGTSLKRTLMKMGMELPFDDGAADFTGLNEIPGTFISDVLHKTFIAVDERGTKAGAVTAVIMADNAAPMEQEPPKEVYLDRPFLFMILDNQNDLPVFIGYVLDPTQKSE